VALLGSRDAPRPPGLDPRATFLAGATYLSRWHGIVVATTARWLWVNERDCSADVCIVDEAWQLTYADLGGLGPLSGQVVLVGDPGQIAPVVTGDTTRWREWATGPQRPAPAAIEAAYPEAVTRLRLTHTYRLGPRTAALIQPAFYPDLPFESARAPRSLELDSQNVPELDMELVQTVAGPGDPALTTAAAARVRQLLGAVLATDGNEAPRRLTAADIAVITPHVEQASAMASRLADIPGLLIGTANQAQGLEREAVVVLHPLAGYRETPAFATDLGRLCVALSRHRTHATVIADADTAGVLRHARAENPQDAALMVHEQVLDALRS
jgi:hypothetical protein